MRISLTGVRSRSLFFVAILLLGGGLGFLGGEAWLAEHWSASASPALWRKAAALEPGDADAWARLGLYEEWNLNGGEGRQAIADLTRAVRTNPRSADFWMDLADAYRTSGDMTGARQAYERAQADYPMSAEVDWRYGSFLLYEGDFPRGYAEIKRSLMVEPSLAATAISECWQAKPDIGAILDHAMPAKSEDYVAALDFFLAGKLLDPALIVWNRQVALGLPIQMAQAIPLVNALIDKNRLADARQTWQQALEATKWPTDRGGASVVFNGGFENNIAYGGFDWREIPVSDAQFAYDSQVAHSGARSMRIEFDGTANVDFQNLFQYVPVHPRTHYHFSAYLRTDDISTRSGMRFEIFDPHHPSEVQVLTPNLTGTNSWTLVQVDFSTGPDTRLLEIALRRMPEWRFDNKLRGTVWIDDVALVPEQAPVRAGGGAG